jgi:hypothetical protein
MAVWVVVVLAHKLWAMEQKLQLLAQPTLVVVAVEVTQALLVEKVLEQTVVQE